MAGLSDGDRGERGSHAGPGTAEQPAQRRDRAQVILLAAFSLAVAFVALSVIINSAIYTQNLATRGETGGSDDALHYRSQVEGMAGDLLEDANANYSSSSTIRDEFRASLAGLDEVVVYQQASSGRAVNVSYLASTEGRRIYNGAGNFTNATGAENWAVAEDVGGTRQFDIHADTSTLDPAGASPFVVNVSNGSAAWRMEVYESGGDLTVTTTDGTGTTATCSASGGGVDINVTAGLLGGRPCTALDFGQNLSGDYEILFNNSDAIEGRYSMAVEQPSTVGNVSNEPALYSATLRYTYRTSDAVYRTDIRVAPGEPDG